MSSTSALAPAGARVALALAAVYLIWGSTYLGIHFALEGGFPPFLLGGVRFIIAGSLMYAVLRWRGMPAPTRVQWGNAAMMGVFLLVLGNGMVNLAQNMTVRIVSVVAVLFLPPTLIASVYGMNFRNMPELDTTWGYPVSLGLMVLSGLATYLFFKWKNWL